MFNPSLANGFIRSKLDQMAQSRGTRHDRWLEGSRNSIDWTVMRGSPINKITMVQVLIGLTASKS